MGLIARTLVGALAAAGAVAAAGRWGHGRARRRYEEALERALADGTLSDEEREQLERLRGQEHLSPDEIRLVALSIYRKALRSAAEDNRLTADEEARLAMLQTQLGLSDADIAADDRQYSRLRLLAGVERGRLLPVIDSPFTLGPGEQAHWLVRATAGERIALGTQRMRARGSRFPLPAGETFELTGARPALATDSSFLPRDLGTLVITDRRSVFRGARQRLEFRHEDVGELVVFDDGLGLATIHGELNLFLVEDVELTAAIVYQAARRRQLGPDTRPIRSA
jgi:hypothetical protein